jgi:hypothetical protein
MTAESTTCGWANLFLQHPIIRDPSQEQDIQNISATPVFVYSMEVSHNQIVKNSPIPSAALQT